MQAPKHTFWTGVVFLTAIAVRIRAADVPTLPIRWMTIEADVIVIGKPVVSEKGAFPLKYKVAEILKGPAALMGHEMLLRDEGMYSGTPPSWMPGKDGKKPLAPIVKALLFLRNPQKGRASEGYGIVLSGVRALTQAGEVLVPCRLTDFGPPYLYLLPVEGEKWETMVAQVRDDLPKIERIRELGRIPDQAEKNQAVLKWIEGHKDELGGCHYGAEAKGWWPLEQEIFQWVMESCIPDDCWRAIELATELDTGPSGNFPSFCSRYGRKLLLDKVFDPRLSMPLRLRALGELGYGGTLWYAHRDLFPRTDIVVRDEQETIIDRIVPLFARAEAPWRAAAVRCVRAVSSPYDANFNAMATKLAVPHLVELYRTERNAEVRSEIAEALRSIEVSVPDKEKEK